MGWRPPQDEADETPSICWLCSCLTNFALLRVLVPGRCRKTEQPPGGWQRRVRHGGVAFGGWMHCAAVNDTRDTPERVVDVGGVGEAAHRRIGHGGEERIIHGADPAGPLGIRLESRRRDVALERLVQPALRCVVEAVAVAEAVAIECRILRIRGAEAVLEKRAAVLVHIGHALALGVLAAAAIA